jgi:hypothetical protein
MRINLRKINQLIRDAWQRGQREALRGAGKSSCYSWSLQAARDFFPDIDPMVAARIAQGKARLHWDDANREIVLVATGQESPILDGPPPSAVPEGEIAQAQDWIKGVRIHLSLQQPDSSQSEITSTYVTPVMLEAAEDLLQTLTTGERPPPKGLYELCATAFGTTRDDAKKRLLGAMYGKPGKAIES